MCKPATVTVTTSVDYVCQPVSVCPENLANQIPSNQVIPEQHTAYHHLTISHTGDKLKPGRHIAWNWWPCGSTFQVWWPADKFGGVLRTSLVALVILRTSLVVNQWCVCKFGGVSPATDTRTTPRSASGGHVMQVWWSFGSAEVRCHGWVV